MIAQDSLSMAFVLLVVFQLKHFLADYPLQRPYMLGKAQEGWGFVWPLIAHCLVHSSLTLIVLLICSRLDLWWLALVDFTVHFIMDRIKSGPNFLGRYRDRNTAAYWNSFGFDQMVHHLTHIYIVWEIIRTRI